MAVQTLAIHGRGLLPGLLALHLQQARPDRPLLLLSPERALGGVHLEPVVTSRLSLIARNLVEPCVVSCWPGYHVIQGGKTALQEEEVLLLDPVQLWLKLQERFDPAALISPCGHVALEAGRLSWEGGAAPIDQLVDLDPLLGGGCESEIVGVEAARQLALPVLADFDEACSEWSAHQYLPLGDERLVIRKLPHGDHLITQQSTFEMLLNGLTAA